MSWQLRILSNNTVEISSQKVAEEARKREHCWSSIPQDILKNIVGNVLHNQMSLKLKYALRWHEKWFVAASHSYHCLNNDRWEKMSCGANSTLDTTHTREKFPRKSSYKIQPYDLEMFKMLGNKKNILDFEFKVRKNGKFIKNNYLKQENDRGEKSNAFEK